jgi:RNA polymerase sigma factor (sigma-70 family)
MQPGPVDPAGRDRLTAIAFRLLGTVHDAEDAVQSALLRWTQLPAPERSRIREPLAWLTRTVTRICLDELRSARVRHEGYAGPWLPEPLPYDDPLSHGPDPETRALTRDSVSMAFLKVMEHMTPAERAAFVLQDVFSVPFAEVGEILGRSASAAKQLASSGRSRLTSAPRNRIERADHAETVRAFWAACETGDLGALTRLLAAEAVLFSDGGGKVRAALNPIHGADKVSRFVLGVRQRRPDARLIIERTASGAALALVDATGVSGIIDVVPAAGAISEVLIQWNPDKLVRWNET